MVKFQDNTVRDGMQQHNVNKNFRTELSIFELIGQSNVDSVEIGMCASEDDYMMICEEAKKLSKHQEVVVLTRLVKQDNITISYIGKDVELKISEDRQKEVRQQLCKIAGGKAVIEE